MELISLSILFKMLKCHQFPGFFPRLLVGSRNWTAAYFQTTKQNSSKRLQQQNPKLNTYNKSFQTLISFYFQGGPKMVNDLYLQAFVQDNFFYSEVLHSLKLLAENSVYSNVLCSKPLVSSRDPAFCSNSNGSYSYL